MLQQEQTSSKRRKYQLFLYNVLRKCGPHVVLVCAIALSQKMVFEMRNLDCKTLINTLERNKGDTAINDSTLRSLASRHKIPSSVEGMIGNATHNFLKKLLINQIYMLLFRETSKAQSDKRPQLFRPVRTELLQMRRRTSAHLKPPRTIRVLQLRKKFQKFNSLGFLHILCQINIPGHHQTSYKGCPELHNIPSAYIQRSQKFRVFCWPLWGVSVQPTPWVS